MVPEVKIKSIRELIEGNYRIIYRIVNKNLIHILTFHHSSRKLKRSAIRRIIKKNR
ncbi:MAG: type II toxin-antitoxin system RelE/ParE family toxin [Bacteroidota bacterium]